VTAWERGAYTVAALLALGALTLRPVVRALDPVLAAALAPPRAVNSGQASFRFADDPWGTPWRLTTTGALHSVGPDRRDDDGGGDDVLLGSAWSHPAYRLLPAPVADHPAAALAIAALLIPLWVGVTRPAVRAPRLSVAREARRAAGIAALPAALGLAPWFFGRPPALDESAPGFVLVPPRVALALTWAALVFLPALAWRLSRPRADA
jgi:hypothetical protein